ncbi:hypothetical protein PoB_002021900 [Plakobranchus ocellatus]|uniref:Uncharacterized protein n=1 Tax=Plakobranchus ocellatus TaxID=259542 RepID=A0AAV3ZIJ2_9GAST|nr:hypothetical protein PoB_002021900 [Plakobranchus ocellatus]
MAAAKNAVESAWRPPKVICSLSGGRRIDSVYAKTTLAQRGITVNKSKQNKTKQKIPYNYCSWQGEMAFTFDEFEDFFHKKIYLRGMVILKERKISGEQLQNFIRGTRSSTV